MTQIALKQLKPNGASDGDAVVYNSTSGVWEPTDVVEPSEHPALRNLIHFIDSGPAEGFASGAYREILPAGDPFYTSVTWWVSSSKVDKIVELTITRNANQTPSQEVWKMYDTDGSTVLVTVTDTISYSGVFETTRTRTIA